MSEPFEIALTVSPEDIDVLGHVNNVVYLRWVQEVATAHWRALAPAADQEARVWVVLRHEIDYEGPARPGEEIVARTWVGGAGRLSFERHTEILRAAGRERLAKARTLWCPLDAKTLRPAPVSAEVRRLFSAASGRAERLVGELRLRDAAEGDAPALAALLEELGHPFPAARVGRQVQAVTDAGGFVRVAEKGGAVVGLASGFTSAVLHRAAPVGRLSVLVVARHHAGRGVGSALLEDAEALFRAQGCARLELTSAAHRTDAHAFYERRGWARQGVRYSRDL